MKDGFFEMLRTEHQGVMRIIEDITRTNDNEVERRRDLLLKLRQNLLPHMVGEETVFYQNLINKEESHSAAMHAIEEHHAAKLMLRELEEMNPRGEQWRVKVEVFRDFLKHHIDTEESRVFDVADKVLDRNELDSIFSRYRQVEEREFVRV